MLPFAFDFTEGNEGGNRGELCAKTSFSTSELTWKPFKTASQASYVRNSKRVTLNGKTLLY